MGSWLQTPRWYNYRKSVEPLFAYSPNRGSCKTLHTRINNECPRRYVHRCGTQRTKHTKGHLPLSCFGVINLLDLEVPKQAPINAFYNMSANRLLGLRCKGSDLFWIKQIKMPFMRILHKWQGILKYL